jgi:hypothetical protein
MIADCPATESAGQGGNVDGQVLRCTLCARKDLLWHSIAVAVSESVTRQHSYPERHKPVCSCGAMSSLWWVRWDLGGAAGHVEFIGCRACLEGGGYADMVTIPLDDEDTTPLDLPNPSMTESWRVKVDVRPLGADFYAARRRNRLPWRSR